MAEQPKTRQELYELIRKSSRDEFVLEEMKRLGFWKTSTKKPSVSEELIKRKGELNRQLSEIRDSERAIRDPEQLLKEYRQKRMKESRERQKENRIRREAERIEKAKVWKARKEKEIFYLGEEISRGLNDFESNTDRLQKFNLPDFQNAEFLAKAMKIKVNELQFLAYSRKVSKVSHYRRFYMQKKSGGKRLISAPMPRLKAAQYWILENILNKVPVHESAHGFQAGHSIVSNAQPHVGKDLVINHDFKDFFPTLNFARVKGLFKSLGYSQHIATIFASICTEPAQDQVKMDGINYFVAKGDRHLPQGAPTSPMLTNILCYKLDKRMAGLATKNGFAYTRYADDLSFSASGDSVENLTKLLFGVKGITKAEGFNLHPEKLRIMRKGSRQEVTGIVVNDQLGINRKDLRKFRALLHQIKLTGWKGKTWGKTSYTPAAVWGYANFVSMVKPTLGKKMLEEVKILMKTVPQRTGAEATKAIEKSVKSAIQKQDKPPKKESGGDKPKWKLW